MSRRHITVFVSLALLTLLFGAGCLFDGAVSLRGADVWGALTGGATSETAAVIVLCNRLPVAVTSLLAGASLAVAGLMMQTTFDNPLAGPSILGVSTGASLGVALVMLALGGGAAVGFGTVAATVAGALVGSFGVIFSLLALSQIVRSTTMLLIVGIMLGYLASSVISLLSIRATAEGLQGFVVWGLGSFSGVGTGRMAFYALPLLAVLALSMLMIKPLNALLLGERYAVSMGVSVRSVRNRLLALSGTLTALVTAFCGPIAFIGLIVPHIARMALGSSNHAVLLPATALSGACLGLLTAWLSTCSPSGVIPVNAILPVIGVPVILFVILRRNSLHYFN